MAKLTFTGDVPLVFIAVTDSSTGSTLFAIPGETYELDENPDENLFTPAVTNSKKSSPAPEAVVTEGN